MVLGVPGSGIGFSKIVTTSPRWWPNAVIIFLKLQTVRWYQITGQTLLNVSMSMIYQLGVIHIYNPKFEKNS